MVMEDTYSGLDWREPPIAGPGTGSIVQSRRGKNGDFHVVLPWKDGAGLVHWWRDNFRSELPWSGGTLFGDAPYTGAAIVETDYTSHEPTNVKNLDAVAVTAAGRVEVWSRECGGNFRWNLIQVLSNDEATGAPSFSYTGSCFREGPLGLFNLKAHGTGTMLVAFPSKQAGLRLWWSKTSHVDQRWQRIDSIGLQSQHVETTWQEIDPRPIVGVSAAMFVDRESALQTPSWKAYRSGRAHVSPNYVALALTFADGGVKVYNTIVQTVGSWDGGYGQDLNKAVVYERVELARPLPGGGQDRTPARGRPAAFQSEYLLKKPSSAALINAPQVGDLVVMAPARDGGILFWLKNFGDYNDPVGFGQGWNFQYVIGTALYDDVSCIQTNFLRDNDDHNIEITARRADMEGFDQYWCDFHGNWGGPIHVRGEVTGSVQQGLATPANPSPQDAGMPADPVLALAAIGIDYSVAEPELRAWLADAAYTPYPALAGALQGLIRPGRLARPLQIDVVRGFYEDVLGGASPRQAGDVDPELLRAALLAAWNERYGDNQTAFAALLAPGQPVILK